VVGPLLLAQGLAEGGGQDVAELVALLGRDRPDVDVHGFVVLETPAAHIWFSPPTRACQHAQRTMGHGA
jgi:hypothetical protein